MTSRQLFSLVVGATLALSAPLALGQSPKKEVSYSNKEKAKQRAKEGATAYDAEAYEKALKAFQEAYALNPEPKYLPPIGQCYEHLNKTQEAFDAYNKFLKEAEADNPLRPEIEKRVAAANIIVNKKQQDDAKAAVSNGDKYFSDGEYKKALTFYQSAYALNPIPATLFQAGQCQARLGQPKDAIDSLTSFLAQADPKDAKRATAERQIEELRKTPEGMAIGPEPSKAPKFLFIGAAATGALGAAAGVFSLLPNEGDLEDLGKLRQRGNLQARSALVSDILFGAALAAGVSGLVIYKKSKKKAEAFSVSATPTAVLFSVVY